MLRFHHKEKILTHPMYYSKLYLYELLIPGVMHAGVGAAEGMRPVHIGARQVLS